MHFQKKTMMERIYHHHPHREHKSEVCACVCACARVHVHALSLDVTPSSDMSVRYQRTESVTCMI